MADNIDPNGNKNKVWNLLPNFYRTEPNKKFLHATIEQLIQPGTVKKVNGYVGRQNAKATTGTDVFIAAPTDIRQNYQLEPGFVVEDKYDYVTFVKDYQDYINQLKVFGANVDNHARLNDQEFYSWDPHIDWDKFVNFQNYYWMPYGPDLIKIAGEPRGVISTYTVKVESQVGNNAYVFTPTGLVRNPSIKLYRGKTYNFDITSPGNPFLIKTSRTVGTLDLYKAPEFVNTGIESGRMTITIPQNAPDILYYVSEFDVDLGGVFQILDVNENSSINVEETIVGKKTYTLSNGTSLSNGMRIRFIGEVLPQTYSNKTFYVEGVGTAIQLIDERNLELISSYTESISVLFDTSPFDKMPFNDATSYPGKVDYITVNRGSQDHNPWSRYNRWFHRDVIMDSAAYNGKIASIDQSARAIRPIIEFNRDMRLFNFGRIARADIDLVDDYTTDVFSTIEGSVGYNIDGVPLVKGQNILFLADTDRLVKNRVFKVDFIDAKTTSNELEFVPSLDVTLAYTNYIPSSVAVTGASITGFGPYLVKLTVNRQSIIPTVGSMCEIAGTRYGYNGTFKVIYSSKNSITLEYPTNPGAFGDGNTTLTNKSFINEKDVITFNVPHQLTTRDNVVYSSNGNNTLQGLTSLQTYYVKVLNDYSITLFNDSQLSNAVNITSTSDAGKSYSFTLFYGDPIEYTLDMTFQESEIDSVNNTFLINKSLKSFISSTHFIGNNQDNPTETLPTKVSYRDLVNNGIGGLINGTDYYMVAYSYAGLTIVKFFNDFTPNKVPATIDYSSTYDVTLLYSVKDQGGITNTYTNTFTLIPDESNVHDQYFKYNSNTGPSIIPPFTEFTEVKYISGELPGLLDGFKYNIILETVPDTQYIKMSIYVDADISISANKTSHLIVKYGTRRQIHLLEQYLPNTDDVVLVRQGENYKGTMFWYDGSSWNLAQQKTKVNQTPLFDIVDSDGISYGDKSVYSGSTFSGTKLFSYKPGVYTGKGDPDFPLAYKNIDNVGDILFNFDYEIDSFEYKNLTTTLYKNINTGFITKTSLIGDISYENGWQRCNTDTVQPAIRIFKNEINTVAGNFVRGYTYRILTIGTTDFTTIGAESNTVGLTFVATGAGSGTGTATKQTFDIDVFDDKSALDDLVVRVYINGIRLESINWTLDKPEKQYYWQITINSILGINDIVTLKTFSAQPINSKGFYEVPINLQNNPLNDTIMNFTLGEVIDHVDSIVDNLPGFVGNYPGSSNIRDLGNITQYGIKFVQHSGPMSLSLYHITSETNNVIRAIEKAREDYNNFKKIFLTHAEMLGVDTTPEAQVDLIMDKINYFKPENSPYFFSDMLPYGASTRVDITVLDYRIKTYSLSEVFTLDELSTKAVLVYLNGIQLLHGHEYTFDTQGFVVISAELMDDDIITIYEFENTNGCFIPPTPTKLGIWPKFKPKIYIDNTYLNPKKMIQGHDGSLILAYDDYRDDLILELEKRIYNNIKVQYDPDIFDFTDLMEGYIRPTDYSLQEFNTILSPNFYRWTSLIDRDFTKPFSFDKSNSLTYNYDDHAAPDGRPVPGYWRGIYNWMLDTDRPNLAPWEMLGISDEPDWWTSVYGPAPYTRDNLILWQDLTDGILREPGKSPQRITEYQRPFLIDHIPVDDQGNILSPMMSGLATGYITPMIEGDFVFGDGSPIEAAWRKSSHYPFGVLITAMLMKPAKTFGTLLDRSRIVRNLAGQIVYKPTGLRVRPKDVLLPSLYTSKTLVQTSGIVNYIVDYILSDNLKSYSDYSTALSTINPNLIYRLGAYTSKDKFNLLLDSKTPLSTGSVFIPQENYDLLLNSSSPIKRITYSAVIVTRSTDGYEVKGYSKTQPYFYYYPYIRSGHSVNVGGISEGYVVWTNNQFYAAGKIVEYNTRYYRVKSSHTASGTFDSSLYVLLPELPIVGGKTAIMRVSWDRTKPILLPYSTKLRTIQEVVDFLLGYGEWLKDQGFIFDDFNNTLGLVTNWETSAKEFLFWTTQNWSTGEDKWEEWRPNNFTPFGSIVRYNGDYYKAIVNSEPSVEFNAEDFILLDGLSTIGSSVISLSPAADRIVFSTDLSVVDDIRNSFNLYEILKVDGTPLEPNFINSYREGNLVSYTVNSNDGIYGASFYLIQKEHIVILDNSTVFNDTIYNPTTGYQQERIKISGYVSSDWNGSFNVPGFIFDQAKINEWDQWQDYNLGDIVRYKQFHYTAKTFLPGTETFNDKDWTKLDKTPTAQLLPNWSYKAEQFTDFYSLDSDNFDSNQQKVAQHLIGYQKRQYLSNIIKDDVSEYKFYQGMILEKGTENVFNKLFDVLSADGSESLEFYEEWAIRVGQYGATTAFENIEFILDASLFRNNPQGFELVNRIDPGINDDLIIRQQPSDLYLKPVHYDMNPWPVAKSTSKFLRTTGSARLEDMALVIKTISDLYQQDITTLENGDYIWCGFEGSSWNVYRMINVNAGVTNVEYASGELTITVKDISRLKSVNMVGIKTANFNGFYPVNSVSLNTIKLTADFSYWKPYAGEMVYVYILVSRRIASMDSLSEIILDNLGRNELVWTDSFNDGKSAVWKQSPVFEISEINNYAPTDESMFGNNVSISSSGKLAVIETESGALAVYTRLEISTKWSLIQLIEDEFISNDPMIQNITGRKTAISPDNEWIAVTTPLASKVSSRYVGLWNYSGGIYYAGDIVRSGYRFYEAIYDQSLANSASTITIVQIENRTITFTIGKSSNILTIVEVLPTASTGRGHNESYIGRECATPLNFTILRIIGQSSEFVNSEHTIKKETTQYLIDNFNTSIDNDIVFSELVLNSNKGPSMNTLVWSELPYIPIDKLSDTNSTLTNQGVVSLYKRTKDGYSLVNTLSGPLFADTEKFGTNIVFGDNKLFIGANGEVVYPMEYKSLVRYESIYEPIGSSGTTVKLRTIVGVKPGMILTGTGFTSGQTVESVDYSALTVKISAEPDSQPSGTISFITYEWQYAHKIITKTATAASINSATVVLNNTSDIIVGSLIQDSPHTIIKDQLVTNINSYNVVTLNHDVYITVGDTISFESWNTMPQPYLSENRFGYSMAVSQDTSKVVISAPLLNSSGMVYVFSGDTYELFDIISGQDPKFGESVSISDDGTYCAISSILSDDTVIDQGRVTVYKASTDSYVQYQVIENIKPEKVGLFGSNISFMNDYKTLVIYSAGADNYTPVSFDTNSTVFDDSQTVFATHNKDAGRVDIFDMYGSKWIHSESLVNTTPESDRYGHSIAVGGNSILVGANYANSMKGIVYSYIKSKNTEYGWKTKHYEIDAVDVKKIKQAFLYNKNTNQLITYLDVLDPVQGKIPGPAAQEIKFKTFYDPAVYSSGNSSVNVDEGMAWTTDQVGLLWWDLRTAKFYNSYTDDIVYRNSSWNTLIPGASIDIYEWVETELTPDEWNEMADTEDGLALNISGNTLYGNDVYGLIRTYDNVSKSFTNTYYYWVKNKRTIPDVLNRSMSAINVANLISNPRGSGYKYIQFMSTNSFSLVNVLPYLDHTDVVLSVEYWTVDNINQNIHTQWKLISSNVSTQLPENIELKWFDSLCGRDSYERPVPDTRLPMKLRYGIENRPRQSMFVNRFEALKQVIEQANRVMINYQIAEDRDITQLESYDVAPGTSSGLYDVILDTDAELRFANSVNFVKPSLIPVLTNGRISDVTIITSGSGYGLMHPKSYDVYGNVELWHGPIITVTGTGKDAEILTILNKSGQIIGVDIMNPGYGYNDSTLLTVRNYSALILSDSESRNQWSISVYEPSTQVWSRIQTQSYDTRRFWHYVDWYDQSKNYNQFTSFKHSVGTLNELPLARNPVIGDLIKVRTSPTGGWLLLEKYADSTSVDWTQSYRPVGSQNGTIQFDSTLYNFIDTVYGYDNTLYDQNIFDDVAVKELRIIMTTLRDNIFIGELRDQYLELFFTSVRYALSEQTYLDWIFKSSFIKAKHNVGELRQKVTYNNDNLDDFKSYVDEVKPYRTKVREYVSSYSKLENSEITATDFDLPPIFTDKLDTIKVTVEGNSIVASDALIQSYPWKHWLDNVGYSIIELKIVHGGSGYISNPIVQISGTGGAKGLAYIANGKVNRVILTTPGSGYINTPTVTIEGGLSPDGVPAKVVAIIGNGVVRSNLIKMKFDRLTQTYFITQMQQTENFLGSGSRMQFALTWAPDLRIGNATVTINGIVALRDNYKLRIVSSSKRGYTSYTGTITFTTAPEKDAVISVTYLKDWSLLNAADRIQYYYNPASGELGKDIAQLMTGVDYGGVVVDGMSFVVNGGWDMLPYSKNKWDDYEASVDDYLVEVTSENTVNGDSTFKLPYVPEVGLEINIYYCSSNSETFTRIDGENGTIDTFIGDGVKDEIKIDNTSTGDKYILRKFTSDGSIAPKEQDYDTALSGGNMEYTTATGLLAEDIIVDGDGFVTPTSSPATEEVVPGQYVDAVAIKVFERPYNASARIKFDTYYGDGETTDYVITQQPNSPEAIIVRLVDNNVATIMNLGVDYIVDYSRNMILFWDPPPMNKMISIYSFSFNGERILDIGNFTSNGDTVQYITQAPWAEDLSYLVYVNGNPAEVQLFSTGYTNRTGIRFAVPPDNYALISYVIVAGSEQTFSIVKSERFSTDTTGIYSLQNKVGDLLPPETNMIVRVGDSILREPNNSYFTIGSNRLTYIIDADKVEPYSVTFADIVVIVDNVVLTYAKDYTVDLSGISVKISREIYRKYTGKILTVSIKQSVGYLYLPGNTPKIILSNSYPIGTEVEVISFYKHDVLNIQRTAITATYNTSYAPDTIEYYHQAEFFGGLVQLSRTVIDASYIWVVKNDKLLTPSVDFVLNPDKSSITLTDYLTENDRISLITFSSNVLHDGVAYMQFKDMLNRTHFKRLSKYKQTKLSQELQYNSLTIEIEDGSNFDVPNPQLNKPGIIEIRGERIEYFTITQNNDGKYVLGQLRRGTLGTGTPRLHKRGSYVQDIGASETIPYSDVSSLEQIVSDGITNIVPISFTPSKASNSSWFTDFGYVYKGDYDAEVNYTVGNIVSYNGIYYKNIVDSAGIIPTVQSSWEQYSTIPVDYGQTNDIEVFVGGYDSDSEWVPYIEYTAGMIVTVASYTYQCINTHVSKATFNDDKYTDGILNWKFFVGNIRLKKKPYAIHNIGIHPESPEGDVRFDADFAVDGVSNEIRLTNQLTENTRVTVIKRTGKIWDSTVNIQDDPTPVGAFIRAVPGILYSDIIKYESQRVVTFDSTQDSFDETDKTFG